MSLSKRIYMNMISGLRMRGLPWHRFPL